MSDPIDRLATALADRYRIERELGEGGMATVHLADDLKHHRKVAIKVLKPELAAVIGGERFLAEIRTTANLQHPHILPLFDSGEAEGFLYYVMPYIAEENLRDRIEREGQLGVDEAVRIARNVGEALDYAHRNDVIHRDIKPANILLHDGNPLVADFGIALAVSAAGGGRMTETGLSLGTPHYMSPEQASAERDLTARSDVYSLGCVAYEMLAGHPPHTGPTTQSVLVRILTEDPRPVSEVRRSVPPHVAAAVTKAIEKLPADRFESAREFVAALDDPGFTHVAVAHTVTTSGRSTAPTPTGRRSPFAAALPWALVAVFAALAGWAMLNTPEPIPVTRSQVDLQDRVPDARWVLDFAVAPNGSAFALNQRVDGEPRLAVRRADERDFRTLAGTGQAFGAVLSPAGDQIAYFSRGRGLMKIPTSGGTPQPVVPNETTGPPLLPLDWADDGAILYLDGSQDPNGVRIVPSTGGEPRTVYDAVAFSGQILPGGNVVLSVYDPFDEPEVRFVDVAQDTSWVLVPGGMHPRYANGHLLWADDSGAVWASDFDPGTGVLDEGRSIVLEGVATFRGGWARYDVSENGTLVYSTGGSGATDPQSNLRLVTVTLDGGVIEETLDPRPMQSPAWSPDGRSVAWSGGEPGSRSEDPGIYIYDMQVKDRPRLLTGEGRNYGPVWSPDGTRVAFASNQEGSQGVDIYVKDVEGGGPPTRLIELGGFQSPFDWISEGRMLIRHQNAPWILELPGEGSADTVVVQPFFQSEDLILGAWLDPRSELVSYASSATGASEIYVRTFPDPGPPIKISEGGGDDPHWSPDGNTIYYFRSRNGSYHLWAARIDRGPPLAVLGLDSVMAWPDGIPPEFADLHPDGDRFIAARQVEGTEDDEDAVEEVRFFVVTNWFEEMRARLGDGG